MTLETPRQAVPERDVPETHPQAPALKSGPISADSTRVTPRTASDTAASARPSERVDTDGLGRVDGMVAVLTELIEATIDELPAAIEGSLATIGELAAVDRTGLVMIDHQRQTMDLVHHWHSERVPDTFESTQSIPLSRHPGVTAQLKAAQIDYNDDVEKLDGDKAIDKESLRARGIKANANIPIVRGGEPAGLLFLDDLQGPRRWEPLIPGLKLFVQALAAALGRLEDETRLRRSEERFRVLFEDNPLPVFVSEVESLRIIDANAAALTIYGDGSTLAQRTLDGLHPREEALRLGSVVQAARADRSRSGPWTHLLPSGEPISVEWSTQVTELEGTEVLLSVVHDITEQRALEHRLRHQAFHDTLTGLANRALLEEQLTQALASRETSANSLAVLLLDLDGFKTVNDSLGHQAGDDLLLEAASRIRSSARRDDIVARLGGDEFVVMVRDADAVEAARRVAERVDRALGAPFELASGQIVLSASVGIAAPSADGWSADTLLRNADLAMYAAKDAGRGRIVEYAPELADRAHDRFALIRDLHHALAHRQLCLHYQPTVDLPTGLLRGVEALLRWEHPEQGLLLPSRFLSHIEDTPLIDRVGRWALDDSCRQMADWRTRFGWSPPTAVNIAVRQLADPDFVEFLRSTLERHGVAPDQLTLEITERSFIGDETLLRRLETLRELGVRLAIDDFGTGYSSLSYLRDLPVDIIKIDQSFIAAMTGLTGPSTAVVATIAELASVLGMEIVAEGVELASQRSALQHIGCEVGQGYLFAHPRPAEELEPLIETAIVQ